MDFPDSTKNDLLLRLQRQVEGWSAEELTRLHGEWIERMRHSTLLGDSFTDAQAAAFLRNRIEYRRRAERERREEELAQHMSKALSVSMKVAKDYVARHPEAAEPKAPPPVKTPEQERADFARAYGVSEKTAENYLNRRRNQPQPAPAVENRLDEKAEARRERAELDAWYRSKNTPSRS